ncbi:ATP-NAD kinase [Yamadazyma tenuis ATCC 10573]|uniref:ATP-NAD kinase n=2 Tax=Candida tenuis TaxID=2315449 RepID=G3BF07_CANTC|nr:ATP-NAD kinase [Yamadazyma tenuis ATCC 10573]EGV59980.1 ATP-NAD kinase [Yamadazyma tenuis ATCC 10573]
MVDIINYISQHHQHANIILSEHNIDELQHPSAGGHSLDDRVRLFTGEVKDIRFKADVLMTIGGDGTILRAVSQFSNFNVPPILSFSMGTLGFLLPFDVGSYRARVDELFANRLRVLQRSRLECHVIGTHPSEARVNMVHAMNEITLHRGSNPNLISLDVYVDGECLTSTTADGIIVSTPTGSTAYSLSSGGSIVHPSIRGLLLTPICPRSLSFRPLILPSTSDIMIRLSQKSRNVSVKLTIDGIELSDMRHGDEIHIRKQLDIDNHIWCMAQGDNDWTKDINDLLGFNKQFNESKR